MAHDYGAVGSLADHDHNLAARQRHDIGVADGSALLGAKYDYCRHDGRAVEAAMH